MKNSNHEDPRWTDFALGELPEHEMNSLRRIVAKDAEVQAVLSETEELISHAQEKLQRKNVDIIVANDVSAPEVGFGHETNEVTILEASGEQRHVTLRSKRQIADEVLDTVTQMLAK